jgi:hypothetical protein
MVPYVVGHCAGARMHYLGCDVKRCSPRHAGGGSAGTLTSGDGVKAGIASAQDYAANEGVQQKQWRIRCQGVKESSRCEG